MSRPPLDQAHGLRRLFAHAQVRIVPVVSNPHVDAGGLMLERLCAAFVERGLRTLVVDAAERAADPAEASIFDLGACIEPLSSQVSYLAAHGLPARYVDATGSTHAFVRAVIEASPSSQVILVHAAPSDLARLFSRRARHVDEAPVCPLLLADDKPASVTHAYAAMKLLASRADIRVFELLLGASARSPRAARIAAQIAICADEFFGAMLRDWLRVDPAPRGSHVPTPALRRWVESRLQRSPVEAAAAEADTLDIAGSRSSGSRFSASNRAFH